MVTVDPNDRIRSGNVEQLVRYGDGVRIIGTWHRSFYNSVQVNLVNNEKRAETLFQRVLLNWDLKYGMNLHPDDCQLNSTS